MDIMLVEIGLVQEEALPCACRPRSIFCKCQNTHLSALGAARRAKRLVLVERDADEVGRRHHRYVFGCLVPMHHFGSKAIESIRAPGGMSVGSNFVTESLVKRLPTFLNGTAVCRKAVDGRSPEGLRRREPSGLIVEPALPPFGSTSPARCEMSSQKFNI